MQIISPVEARIRFPVRWGEILAATAPSYLEIPHQKLERRSPGEDDFPPVEASPRFPWRESDSGALARIRYRCAGANPFPVRWGEILVATALSYLESIVGEMQSGRRFANPFVDLSSITRVK